MKTTIKDIAKATGVSPSTVSRALHDSERISKDVRERVQKVAREMNFTPNQMALGLQNRQSRIVGVVFSGDAAECMGHPFYPAVIQGLAQVATQRHYHLLLATGSEVTSMAEIGYRLSESGIVSGLVYLAGENIPTSGEQLATVVIGRTRDANSTYSVDNDNVALGRAAAEHLIALGHKKLMFLGQDNRYYVTEDRRKGFEEALRNAGLEIRPEWMIHEAFIKGAENIGELKNIFLSDDHPTGVVSMDDALSIGLCGQLGAIGLSVPEDVSVISINHTDAGQYHMPPLTSYDVHPERLGISAMNLLIDVIENRETASRMLVSFTLSGGASTAQVKQEE